MKNLLQILLFLGATIMTPHLYADNGSLIFFGTQEVKNAQLKSENGELPKVGLPTTLRVFKSELALLVYDDSMAYQGGYGAFAKDAHLFIRFNSQNSWAEINLKGANVNLRGPSFNWEEFEDVNVNVPIDADRIEAWIKFDRFRPTDCYLSYDMMECSTLTPWHDPGYISNNGHNFQISVSR